MEILTGLPAGTIGKNGQYPPKSINGIITKRLNEFFKKSQEAESSLKQNKKQIKKGRK